VPDVPDDPLTDVPLFAARQGLGELVEQVRSTGRPVYLTKHGRRIAKIVALADDEAGPR
jgi:prevent-host-death family protein